MADDAQLTVWVETAIKDAMDTIKETKGIPLAAQMRFAILAYLETQGENPLKIKRAK